MKYFNKIAGCLIICIATMYMSGCKGHTDALPSASSSFIPGTSCLVSEVKYFSNDNDSMIGGVLYKYTEGKLSNMLYYKKGQEPGDNGYRTLLYNSDGTLREILIYTPETTINFFGITTTIPSQNMSSKYTYEAGRLIKINQSPAPFNVVFIDSADGASAQYNYGYYADGKLQYKARKIVGSTPGISFESMDSTLYENYIHNRPQNTSEFSRILIYTFIDSSKTDTTDTRYSILKKYVYDDHGNRIRDEFLNFKLGSEEAEAATFGQSASVFGSLVDSISVDVESDFDVTKPNVAYAFRYLNPENIDDIDPNLPVSAKAGCFLVNSNYTFNASGLPDKLYPTFSIDGDCPKLGDAFDKLNGFFGKALPINNTYAKYYYTGGCK